MGTRCPLCDKEAPIYAVASDIEYFTSDQRFAYHRCDNCEVLFVSPMLADRLTEIYPPTYYSFVGGRDNFAQKIKKLLDRRWISKLTTNIPGDALSVLDVGGGAGSLLDLVKACEPRVQFTQVVDIDAGAADIARAAGHQYALTPFEHYESDRRFDLILMLNLIEHVARPAHMLAKAKELLSPRGVIVIQTPNFDALDAKLFKHRSWGGFHAPRHFVLFTKKSFLEMARTTGLVVDRFSYVQGAPFWSISVANELRRVGLIKASKSDPLALHPVIPYLQAIFALFDFVRLPVSKLSQMMIVLKRC